MCKITTVGDPHVKISNLVDCNKLIDMVEAHSIENNVDYILFTGDLMDAHGVVRSEVLDFWYKTFVRLTARFKVLALVGNHDITNPNKSEKSITSLSVFENLSKNLTIISSPLTLSMAGIDVAFVPFNSDLEGFVSTANNLHSRGATQLIFAHQNFTIDLFGDKIDMNRIPQKQIVTGHIHKRGLHGKVLEVGTPKYDSVTDANEDKGFHILKVSAGGYEVDKFISTKYHLTTIEKLIVKEGEEVNINKSDNVSTYLELVGSNAWITKVKKELKGQAQIKGIPTDRVHKVQIANSEDLKIKDYIDNFKFLVNIDKNKILNYLGELGCNL